MSNNFKLSAVAVALATMSGSVIADVQYNGFSVIGPTNSVSVAIDGLPVGNTVSASVDSIGVTINNTASTVTAGGTAVSGADLVIPTVNSSFASTTQVFNQDRVDQEINQQRTESQQLYN